MTTSTQKEVIPCLPNEELQQGCYNTSLQPGLCRGTVADLRSYFYLNGSD